MLELCLSLLSWDECFSTRYTCMWLHSLVTPRLVHRYMHKFDYIYLPTYPCTDRNMILRI